MKKSYIVLAIAIMVLAGCQSSKKISDAEFIGIWNGKMHKSGEEEHSITVEMQIKNDLNGTFEIGGDTLDIEGELSQETMSFLLPLPEDTKEDPQCKNWNVSCEGKLSSDKKSLSLGCKGVWCGAQGKIEGVFTRVVEKE